MLNIEKEIEEKFGGRLRTRVNGILIEEDKILMVKHRMSQNRFFWNVPGGGMKYGTSAVDNLIREFKEETQLDIKVDNLLFVYEYLEIPLHAVELYFEVENVSGNLKAGIDPELDADGQIITEIRFMTLGEIHKIRNEEKHRMFWGINSINDIRIWKGYFNFENKCIK